MHADLINHFLINRHGIRTIEIPKQEVLGLLLKLALSLLKPPHSNCEDDNNSMVQVDELSKDKKLNIFFLTSSVDSSSVRQCFKKVFGFDCLYYHDTL